MLIPPPLAAVLLLTVLLLERQRALDIDAAAGVSLCCC